MDIRPAYTPYASVGMVLAALSCYYLHEWWDMRIKSGVNISGIRPEIVLALIIARSVYSEHNTPLVVTCVQDGKHMPGSLHYLGLAADIRTGDLKPKDRSVVRKKLKESLGPQYDVVLEKTHIHIEFQPKEAL